MAFVPFSFRALALRINWKKKSLEQRIYDGDSVWLLFDEGKYSYSCANCRLTGINTPEMNDKDPVIREDAQKAKVRLIELVGGKEVFVRSDKLDKYGRPLVTIWLKEEDFGDYSKSVNQQMINEGLAVPYNV